MDTTKLKENLQQQISNKQQELLDKQYIHVIQSIIAEKYPHKPIYIKNDKGYYDVDNLEYIANRYTPYLQ